MTCATCASSQIYDPKNKKRSDALKAMAKQGWIVCNLSPYRATFHPLDHVCGRFERADDDVVKARMEWQSARCNSSGKCLT